MFSDLQVPAGLTPAQAEAALKRQVLEFIEGSLDSDGFGTILTHDGDPVYYDPSGEWTYDRLTVSAGGNVEAALDRPLRSTMLLPARFKFP